MQHAENLEQKTFVKWFKLQYPQFKKLITTSISGQNLGPKVGARVRDAGYCKGWPDITIAVTTNQFPGLYIELKCDGRKTTKEQDDVLFDLNNQGYKAVVCHGWIEAKNVTEEYLNGEKK